MRIYFALSLAQTGCLSLLTKQHLSTSLPPLPEKHYDEWREQEFNNQHSIFISVLTKSIGKMNSRNKTCFFLQLERSLAEEETGILFELFLTGKFKKAASNTRVIFCSSFSVAVDRKNLINFQ